MRMLQRNRAAWAEENSRARKLQNGEGAGGARKRDTEEEVGGKKPKTKRTRNRKTESNFKKPGNQRQQRTSRSCNGSSACLTSPGSEGRERLQPAQHPSIVAPP